MSCQEVVLDRASAVYHWGCIPGSPADWCIASGANISNEWLCLRHDVTLCGILRLNASSVNFKSMRVSRKFVALRHGSEHEYIFSTSIFVTRYCFVCAFASERALPQEMDLDLDKAASRLKKEQKARIEKVCIFVRYLAP